MFAKRAWSQRNEIFGLYLCFVVSGLRWSLENRWFEIFGVGVAGFLRILMLGAPLGGNWILNVLGEEGPQAGEFIMSSKMERA